MTSERTRQKQKIARQALNMEIRQNIIEEETPPIIPRGGLPLPKGAVHEVIIYSDGTWADIYKNSTPIEEHKSKQELLILSGPNKNCEDILD